MKIGIYTVEEDWRGYNRSLFFRRSEFTNKWIKKIYESANPINRRDLELYKTKGNTWLLGYNVFAKEYSSMFGDEPEFLFYTDTEAKQHIDFFLNKLSKLIYFT